MAIKTTEITDKVQILKGTVQKQMILRYVLFQTKKMLFVVVLVTTTLLASVSANGRHRTDWMLQFVQPLWPLLLSQISITQHFNMF